MILYSPVSAGCLVLFVTSLVEAHPISLDQMPDDDDEGNPVKKNFAQLLNNIVKVNEDRLKAMKTLSRFQGTAVDGNPRNRHKALRSGFDDEGRSDGVSKSDGEGNGSDNGNLLMYFDFANDGSSVLSDNILSLRNGDRSEVKTQHQTKDLEPYKSLQQNKKPARNKNNKKKKPLNDDSPSDDKSAETDSVFKQKSQALRAKWRKSCDKAAAKNCKKACTAAYKQACDSYKCKSKLKKAFKRNCKEKCRERFYSSRD